MRWFQVQLHFCFPSVRSRCCMDLWTPKPISATCPKFKRHPLHWPPAQLDCTWSTCWTFVISTRLPCIKKQSQPRPHVPFNPSQNGVTWDVKTSNTVKSKKVDGDNHFRQATVTHRPKFQRCRSFHSSEHTNSFQRSAVSADHDAANGQCVEINRRGSHSSAHFAPADLREPAGKNKKWFPRWRPRTARRRTCNSRRWWNRFSSKVFSLESLKDEINNQKKTPERKTRVINSSAAASGPSGGSMMVVAGPPTGMTQRRNQKRHLWCHRRPAGKKSKKWRRLWSSRICRVCHWPWHPIEAHRCRQHPPCRYRDICPWRSGDPAPSILAASTRGRPLPPWCSKIQDIWAGAWQGMPAWCPSTRTSCATASCGWKRWATICEWERFFCWSEGHPRINCQLESQTMFANSTWSHLSNISKFWGFTSNCHRFSNIQVSSVFVRDLCQSQQSTHWSSTTDGTSCIEVHKTGWWFVYVFRTPQTLELDRDVSTWACLASAWMWSLGRME